MPTTLTGRTCGLASLSRAAALSESTSRRSRAATIFMGSAWAAGDRLSPATVMRLAASTPARRR